MAAFDPVPGHDTAFATRLPAPDVTKVAAQLPANVLVRVLEATDVSKSQQYLRDKAEKQRSEIVLDVSDDEEPNAEAEISMENSKSVYKYAVQDAGGGRAFMVTEELIARFPVGSILLVKSGSSIWRGVLCIRNKDVEKVR